MPLRQPLPCTIPLFHNETLDSFLRRLATANHLPTDRLLPLLHIRRTTKTPANSLLEPLATAAGVHSAALELALPEFFDDDSPGRPGTFGRPRTTLRTAVQRPACRRCTHTAGITMPVTCWTTHERNICLRHRLWIGDGITNAEERSTSANSPTHYRPRNTTGT
ncbi:TniQ family protein [Streptomyces cavernae]|uniref:TniQ family protein n=1 Tax=Streptomyces cavernae TaxID=2259034 RepID=UPI000FEB8AAD|nr:TniQ family protein [Streptomyces cavernae]